MNELLPAWPLLSTFLLASFVLAVTPGPGVLYILTRSMVQGRRAGLASVAGVALGNLGNAAAAAIGLAALFAVSALAFSLVKIAGALYLVWLGVQMLRAREQAQEAISPPPATSLQIFRDGVVVSLLNPKTTLFFAAFLPQFIDAASQPLAQSLVLGTLFVAIAAMTDSIYALAAGCLAPVLRTGSVRAWGRRLGAALFIGLGLRLATDSR